MKRTMTVSPWLVDAAVGATGQTYEIRTITDFFRVPDGRRRICLREFHAWLGLQEGVTAMLTAPGPHAIRADQLQWKNDVFRWSDDGKAIFNVIMQPGQGKP